jgi:hypothetical protein
LTIFFSAAPRVASVETRWREERGLRMFPSYRQIKFGIPQLKRTATLSAPDISHNPITVCVTRKFFPLQDVFCATAGIFTGGTGGIAV